MVAAGTLCAIKEIVCVNHLLSEKLAYFQEQKSRNKLSIYYPMMCACCAVKQNIPKFSFPLPHFVNSVPIFKFSGITDEKSLKNKETLLKICNISIHSTGIMVKLDSS